MANEEHLRILKKGVLAWNDWRARNQNVEPDLTGANLRGMKLRGFNFQKTNFANADIRSANFTNARLDNAKFVDARAGMGKQIFVAVIIISFFIGCISGYILSWPGYYLSWLLHNISNAIKMPLDSKTEGYLSIILFLLGFSILLITIRLKKLIVFIVIVGLCGFGVGSVLLIGMLNGAIGVNVGMTAPSVIAVILFGVGAITMLGAVTVVMSDGLGTFMIFLFTTFGYMFGLILPAESLYMKSGPAVGAASAVCGISLFILSILFILLVIQEDEQFSVVRKIALFLGSYPGTRFDSSILTGSDFTGATIGGARFGSCSNITYTCWKNAKKMHLANFRSTPLEIKKVRDLLVSLNQNIETDFNGINLQSCYLVKAALRNADLRNSDLDGADLSYADITGAKLFATSRENWEIEA